MKAVYTGETLPKVTREFVAVLSTRFAPLNIQPDMSMEEIMFNAGQQSIIQFMQAYAASEGTHEFNNREAR